MLHRHWSTLKKLILYKAVIASASTTLTVTGVSPLSLLNAVAHSLVSLTQYGKVEQRNLPQGYTQVEYIASDATDGYVDTGIVINSIDTEVEIDYQFTATPSAVSPAMVWGFMGNQSNLPRWGFAAYGGQWLGSVNQTSSVGSFNTNRHTAVMRVYMDGEDPMWDGTLDGVELYAAASLPSPSIFTGNTLPVMLFARNNNSTAGNFAPAKIYSFKVRKAGVLVNNLVPCKTASAVGFYDTVTGNFLTGTGLSAGADSVPTPSTPMDIVCNNGRVVAGNCISSIPDGQGTFITPSELTTNRVYKAFPTDLVVGRSYTVTITGTNWLILLQQKNPDGTGGSNVSGWVTTYDFTPEEGYIYGVAMRRSQDNIAPADFNGTLTLDTTDGKPWTDGTPEVLTVSGKNLLDPSAVTAKKYINASGQELPSQSPTGWLNHSDYIAVTVGEDYTLSVTGADGGSNTIAFNWFDENKTILATRPTKNVTSGTTAYTFTNTAPADAAYLIVNFITGTKVMAEESSIATAYEPYVQPQIVNDVPMLLSVGGTKDEVELVGGIKTGKVGIRVFDGTETISTSNACFTVAISDRVASKTALLCSHFPYSSKTSSQTDDCTILSFSSTNIGFRYDACADKTAFAAFLAAQYAAGTPVIVVYPLAEPVTEQGTAHSLHTSAGTNVVTVESNVDPVTVAVEYAASA